MARIAIIAKSLHPQVLNFAEQLYLHKNDVIVITDRKATVPPNLNFEVIQPFRIWNALEVIKLFPRLMGQMPDIFHFVFTNSEETPTMAHFILSHLIYPIPRRVIASSFFHSPRDLSHYRLKFFLKTNRLITFGTGTHLIHARRSLGLADDQVTEVLPPLSELSDRENETHSSEIQSLVETLGFYFIIPSDPDHFLKLIHSEKLNLDRRVKFLFLGDRPSDSKHRLDIYFLGQVPANDLIYAIQKSKGILIAFSHLSLLELQQYYQWSRMTKSPLLIRPQQNEMFPGLVNDQKNGWVLEEGPQSLIQLLSQNPTLRLPKNTNEGQELSIVDSTMNELSRLYSKAFHFQR